MRQPERLGIFGGSFDPIHIGHLAIAEEVRVVLGLDAVIFVPAARQPLKSHLGSTAHQRLAMVRLACADNDAFVVDDLELRRPPPSYTVDTIAALRGQYSATTELWFILGADAARDLPRWRRVDELLSMSRMAMVGRPGSPLDLPALEAALPALAGRAALLAGPDLAISSRELRRRLATGRPVRYQIPEAVRRYITEHGLYRDAAPDEQAAS